MVMIILTTTIINPIIKKKEGKKEKRRPKILTEIKQTNLETNDYDPITTLLPLSPHPVLNPPEKYLYKSETQHDKEIIKKK